LEKIGNFLKKEEIWLLGLTKFSKFSPAALEKKVFGLRIFQNSKNFRLRRNKWKLNGVSFHI